MNKKTKYTNEPIKMEVIDDFLPRPDELVRKGLALNIKRPIREDDEAGEAWLRSAEPVE